MSFILEYTEILFRGLPEETTAKCEWRECGETANFLVKLSVRTNNKMVPVGVKYICLKDASEFFQATVKLKERGLPA